MYAKILAETDKNVLESELNEFLKVIKDILFLRFFISI